MKFLLPILVLAGLGGCSEESGSLPVVSGITLDQTVLYLKKGQTARLSADVDAEDPDYGSIVWSSSNLDIAVVDNEGLVTAVDTGDAQIIASAGLKSAVCRVSITEIDVETASLDREKLTLLPGQSEQLEITVVPVNAHGRHAVWGSSDEGVVTVSDGGLVTAVAVGEAVVTATAGSVVVSCSVSVVESLPEVGDYFYADGSCSSDLDASKTPIGIVFWTGDPTASDAALRREHPACTHGLAVALGGEAEISWQANYFDYIEANDYADVSAGSWIEEHLADYASIRTGMELNDPFNRIVGYNNTKAIEAFNADPSNAGWPVDVVARVAAYRETVKAPEETSGWYLPSPKELSLLCSGDYEGNIANMGSALTERRDLVNEKIARIAGAVPIPEEGTLWSSSEYGTYSSYMIYISTGSFSHGGKSESWNSGCRYVLAF